MMLTFLKSNNLFPILVLILGFGAMFFLFNRAIDAAKYEVRTQIERELATKQQAVKEKINESISKPRSVESATERLRQRQAVRANN
jgi:ribosomal protein L31E